MGAPPAKRHPPNPFDNEAAWLQGRKPHEGGWNAFLSSETIFAGTFPAIDPLSFRKTGLI
jgi:hypothetical protein